MSRPSSSLIVASFATQAELSVLASTISHLDYAPEILPGPTWLDHASRHSDQKTILFFGSADYPRPELLN